MATSEEKTVKPNKTCEPFTASNATSAKPCLCTICGKPATQLVDGEPSCQGHVEQVYEHQVEDYTSAHLADNEWRKG
jgi:hypothetical protein